MSVSPPNSLGLYFSVPFCRAKCTYCNFASGVYPASEHARYVDRLLEEFRGAADWAASMQVSLPRQVDTIYFGGGTPVLLAPELLTRIFQVIRELHVVDADAEITVECAPGQLEDATLEAMIAAGVNRISLGVQSFIDREASLSGRLHTRADVLNDLRRLRAAGIDNLNLDLLAGLADQTRHSWRESLAVLVDTGVPHASVYMLEIDEDSRLGRELLDGGTRYSAGLVPSDDIISAMYEDAEEAFAKAGLQQYEISNFAQPGKESRHNLRYWQRRPYLGVGLEASSMLCSSSAEDSAVLRSTMTDDLKEFLTEDPSTSETAWLGPVQQLEEAWFLGLRRNIGVSIHDIRREFGDQAARASVAIAKRLAKDDLLQANGQTFRLTSKGRLLSNEVFAEFIGLAHNADLDPMDLTLARTR